MCRKCVHAHMYMSVVCPFQLSVSSEIKLGLPAWYNKHLYLLHQLLEKAGLSLHIFCYSCMLIIGFKKHFQNWFLYGIYTHLKNVSLSITPGSTACGFQYSQFAVMSAHKVPSDTGIDGTLQGPWLHAACLGCVVCQALLSFSVTLRCLSLAFFPLSTLAFGAMPSSSTTCLGPPVPSPGLHLSLEPHTSSRYQPFWQALPKLFSVSLHLILAKVTTIHFII